MSALQRVLDRPVCRLLQVVPVDVTRAVAILLVAGALTGCVSLPIIGPALLLARADREAREGAWTEAVASYDEYLARYPDDSAAPRVRDSRDTLAAILTAGTELTRRREEVAKLRNELVTLQDEGARLREDGTRLRAEATVLRDEVIKLRDERIHLRAEGTQLREELMRRAEELTRREDALARARQELAVRQAEAERLRSDIERLKQIDLKLERKR
jgi:chromosome segregation ATPase